MFYRDSELFIKQAVVDRYVDDLAYTLGVERDAMNVVCWRVTLPSTMFSLRFNRSPLQKVLLPALSSW